jgi:hypothetical protein
MHLKIRRLSDVGRPDPEQMKSEPGPPMTLGAAAAAGVRLIVWCQGSQHQVEPHPTEQAQRYGEGTTVPD